MDVRYGSWTTFTGQVVVICHECGVEVLRQDKHDDFHSRLDSIQAVADDAYLTVGPLRRIG